MSRRITIRIAALIVAAAHLSACSLSGPRMQTITVSSDPEGAKVRINTESVGTTPVRVQVRRSEDLLIEVQKPGYETAYRKSTRTLSGLGFADLVGGVIILIPLIGLISPAAWEHEPASFGVTLDPEAPAEPAADQ